MHPLVFSPITNVDPEFKYLVKSIEYSAVDAVCLLERV